MDALQFSAVALPDGDPQWGVPGPLVMLVERGPGEPSLRRGAPVVTRIRFYSPDEAEQLGKALVAAAFRLSLKPALTPARPVTKDAAAVMTEDAEETARAVDAGIYLGCRVDPEAVVVLP